MKKNAQTFEEYLQYIHMEEYPTVLDDDLPDSFNDWVSELTVKDVDKFAQEYGDMVAYREATVFKFDNGIV